MDAISPASNLHTLRLHVQWIPPRLLDGGDLWAFDRASSPSPSELTESDSSDLDSDYDSDNDGVGGRNTIAHRKIRDAGLNGTSAQPRAAVSRLMAAYGFNPSYNPAGSSETNARRDHPWHRNGNGHWNANGNASWNGRNGNKNIADGGGGNAGADPQQQHHRPFTLDHARALMDREGSKLRVIVIGGVVYTGRWIWDNENAEAKFEVECAGEEE